MVPSLAALDPVSTMSLDNVTEPGQVIQRTALLGDNTACAVICVPPTWHPPFRMSI